MSARELKQELDTGKSVVDIAASKNVSKKDVMDVIAKAQIEVQFEGEETKETEEMMEDLLVKILHVIEYKSN